MTKSNCLYSVKSDKIKVSVLYVLTTKVLSINDRINFAAANGGYSKVSRIRKTWGII